MFALCLLCTFPQGSQADQKAAVLDQCMPIAAMIEASLVKYNSGTAHYSALTQQKTGAKEAKVKVQYVNKVYAWFNDTEARSGYVSSDAECVATFCKSSPQVDHDTKAHLYPLSRTNTPWYVWCHPRYFTHGILLNFVDTGYKRPSLAKLLRTMKEHPQFNYGELKIDRSDAKEWEIHFIPSNKIDRYEYTIDKQTGFITKELSISAQRTIPGDELHRELGKLEGSDNVVPLKVTLVSRAFKSSGQEIATESKQVIKLLSLESGQDLKESDIGLDLLNFPTGGVVNDHRSGKEYLYKVPDVDGMLIDDALQAYRAQEVKNARYWSWPLYGGIGIGVLGGLFAFRRYRQNLIYRRG